MRLVLGGARRRFTCFGFGVSFGCSLWIGLGSGLGVVFRCFCF